MKVKSKGDERKSAVTKTFSWLAGCLLQICGQVNNYACAALRLQRQLSAEGADPFTHALNAEAGHLVGAKSDAVVFYLQAQQRALLKQGNGDFAGVGVLTGGRSWRSSWRVEW